MEFTPIKIKLRTPDGLWISWNDGHEATYSYAFLRQHCPCAACRESPPVVKSSPDLFPIYGKGPIELTGASPVGHYAIQFTWNDGHATGIYTYSYLREICPCTICQTARQD
ncbi:MAG: DUF971 domain-containing protein [Terriglobia bacterium]